MADILHTLREIDLYYGTRRGVGHTTAMKNGTDNSDCLVLFPNRRNTMDVMPFPRWDRIVTLEALDKLRGVRLPLLVEHTAIQQVCRDSASEILWLRERLAAVAQYNDAIGRQLTRTPE